MRRTNGVTRTWATTLPIRGCSEMRRTVCWISDQSSSQDLNSPPRRSESPGSVSASGSGRTGFIIGRRSRAQFADARLPNLNRSSGRRHDRRNAAQSPLPRRCPRFLRSRDPDFQSTSLRLPRDHALEARVPRSATARQSVPWRQILLLPLFGTGFAQP